jgi:nucleotide sugar dehydrogenase
MRVVVVGLGKIGLPLAVVFADAGMAVVGADISSTVVECISRGVPPFPNETGLEERLSAAVSTGRLAVTTDVSGAAKDADVVVVVVPLLIDEAKRPDFSAIDAATTELGRTLGAGTLVSYETTLPVGTTRTRLAPMLAAASGLELGRDLFVCHSPERVSSGSVFADLRRYPKLVGGVDSVSEQRAVAFYREALSFDDRPDLPKPNGVWPMGSSEAAELTKLVETTYRDVNIALANEFAAYAERLSVDVSEIVDAANSQPYSHVHRPGIAVGGHCIPVYPHLYLQGDPEARLPAVSREVNDRVPTRAVALLQAMLGELAGRRVAVLGAAYRGNVKETAFSGVFPLVSALVEAGARPMVHDPLYSDDELIAMKLSPFRLGEPVDAAIVQADHPSYATLSSDDLPGIVGVLDGRGILDPTAFPGVIVQRLGAPARRMPA